MYTPADYKRSSPLTVDTVINFLSHYYDRYSPYSDDLELVEAQLWDVATFLKMAIRTAHLPTEGYIVDDSSTFFDSKLSPIMDNFFLQDGRFQKKLHRRHRKRATYAKLCDDLITAIFNN